MQYNREEILAGMRNEVVEVHFTKEDGSQRVLKGTLKTDLLPSNAPSLEEQTIFHKNHPNLVQCWDVVKNGWRSFRMDSVHYANAATP